MLGHYAEKGHSQTPCPGHSDCICLLTLETGYSLWQRHYFIIASLSHHVARAGEPTSSLSTKTESTGRLAALATRRALAPSPIMASPFHRYAMLPPIGGGYVPMPDSPGVMPAFGGRPRMHTAHFTQPARIAWQHVEMRPGPAPQQMRSPPPPLQQESPLPQQQHSPRPQQPAPETPGMPPPPQQQQPQQPQHEPQPATGAAPKKRGRPDGAARRTRAAAQPKELLPYHDLVQTALATCGGSVSTFSKQDAVGQPILRPMIGKRVVRFKAQVMSCRAGDQNQLPPLAPIRGVEVTRPSDLEHCYGFSERHGIVKEKANPLTKVSMSQPTRSISSTWHAWRGGSDPLPGACSCARGAGILASRFGGADSLWVVRRRVTGLSRNESRKKIRMLFSPQMTTCRTLTCCTSH